MTGEQLSFMAEPAVRRSDPETSRVAAAAVWPRSRELEADIVGYIRVNGGLTDDELASRFPDRHPPTVKTARSRLARRGEVVPSGRTRPSARGKAQTVWIVAP